MHLLKGDFVVLTAVILHQGGRNIHVEVGSLVLSCLLENIPRGLQIENISKAYILFIKYSNLDALGSPAELHVLNVSQSWVDLRHSQEVLVYLVDLLEVHVSLLKVCECEVEEGTLVEDPGHRSLVELTGLVQPLLAVVHVPLLLQGLATLLEVAGRLVPDVGVVTQAQQRLLVREHHPFGDEGGVLHLQGVGLLPVDVAVPQLDLERYSIGLDNKIYWTN